MEGKVVAVCTSVRKGTQKTAVDGPAALLRGHGFEGDAHAGTASKATPTQAAGTGR